MPFPRSPSRILMIFAMLCLSVTALAADVTRDPEPPVLAALLNSFLKDGPVTGTLVIAEQTIAITDKSSGGLTNAKDVKESVAEASTEVILDFLKVGRQQATLRIARAQVNSQLHFLIASRAVLERLERSTPETPGAAFKRFYPDSLGLLQISRVGLNAANNEALVYWQITCGMLCGSGHISLMRLHDGVWREAKQEDLWFR